MYKECKVCKIEKLSSEFYRYRDGSLMARCKECHKTIVSKSFSATSAVSRKASFQKNRKWTIIKHKYGICKEQYLSILNKQNGVCAVCSVSPENSSKKVLHVDHDHSTGKVRGLLCHRCNMALGSAKDNPELLFKLAAYVTPPVQFSRLEG